ncbi:MAG: hypothetical protein JO047_12135 [Alphaproteobacteria bacterium]|nr:hypothetical protein [Alphaproteobacteria bacterium]
MDDNQPQPKSLLPYDDWTEEALRGVVARALGHVARDGLPGGHHFYITFRTDHPGVQMPARLRSQYRQEMTIVLQHQFWDLRVDEAADTFTVGLSFGGVPTMLTVPLPAVTAFVDPEIRFGLQFRAAPAEASPATTALVPQAQPEREAQPESGETKTEAPQVVSLDAFRRRPPKES